MLGTLSLIFLMHHSISGTCSSADAMFKHAPNCDLFPLTCSNWMSVSISTTLNPLSVILIGSALEPPQVWLFLVLHHLRSYELDMSWDANQIWNLVDEHNVNCKYHLLVFRYEFDWDVYLAHVHVSVLSCVVFPFNDLRSGPKMCSAASMSILVTGQFAKRLLSTRWMKSVVLGLPMIRSIFWTRVT